MYFCGIFTQKTRKMKRFIWFAMAILGIAFTISAQRVEDSFVQEAVSDAVFARMEGKSFGRGCTTPREDLRYLRVLHYNKEGEVKEGELVCHRSIADDLLSIFRELYKAKYPIERVVLIDEYGADDEASMRANNSSSFNFRRIEGTKRLSSHSRGMAIDINPLYNPYIRQRNGRTLVSPQGAEAYTDRTKDFPYKIVKGDLCYRLFKKHGFTWGGKKMMMPTMTEAMAQMSTAPAATSFTSPAMG